MGIVKRTVSQLGYRVLAVVLTRTSSKPHKTIVVLCCYFSAAETVDICSDGTTHITGRSVNISSSSYPSLHRIRNNITCSCHVTTGHNSRADILIEPKDIEFTVNDNACYASIELWNPVDRVDRELCLNLPSKNVNNTAEFKSVFLINITYQAFRPRPRRLYQGKFLISFTGRCSTVVAKSSDNHISFPIASLFIHLNILLALSNY